MAELPHARGRLMAKNKNQHYVSAFYLYGFTSKEQRLASEGMPRRKTDIIHYSIPEGIIKERPIEKVAIEPYLLSYPDGNGSMNHGMDEIVKDAEDNAARAIEEIGRIVDDSFRRKPRMVAIGSAIEEALLDFMYWQIIRNPALISETKKEFESFLASRELPTVDAKQLALRVVGNFGDNGKCDIRAELRKKNKTILCISRDDAHFITTDKPFVRFNKTAGNGIAMPGTQIYFPITSRLLMYMNGNGNWREFRPYNDRKQIRGLNAYIAQSAFRYIFGPSKPHLERVVASVDFLKRPAIPADNFAAAVSRAL